MGTNRKKFFILIILISLFFGLLSLVKKSIHKSDSSLNGNEDYDMKVVEDNNSKMDFHSAFKVLDQDLLGEGIAQWIDETLKEKIFIYSEAVKGEFAEVQNSNSIFPMELIRKFEEMIYQSLDNSLRKNSWEETQKGIYFETVEALGANDFEMNLGEIIGLFPMLKDYEVENIYDAYKIVSGNKNCEKIFRFHMNGNQDNYIFVIDTGGAAGIKSVKLNKRVNDGFILISEFETQNSGYGRVIQFEDEFYYVFLEYNYNLKNYDGVRIYKLGYHVKQENLRIKYFPYNYIWKNVYDISQGTELETYIVSIKEYITSDSYLENGKVGDIAVFYGDEKEIEDFMVSNNEEHSFVNEYYMIDFANIGIPVYMRKSNLIPLSYRDIWHLRSCFYMQDPENGLFNELQELEIGNNSPIVGQVSLVQMWFKEIEKKVYTFCLYHVSDYNYVLNVSCLEGDEITRIRTDMICPQRHFVLTEGEEYYY